MENVLSAMLPYTKNFYINHRQTIQFRLLHRLQFLRVWITKSHLVRALSVPFFFYFYYVTKQSSLLSRFILLCFTVHCFYVIFGSAPKCYRWSVSLFALVSRIFPPFDRPRHWKYLSTVCMYPRVYEQMCW